MNYLIEFLCGIVMVVILTSPIAYYGVWNLAKLFYVSLVSFVTEGDKTPNFNYSNFEEDFEDKFHNLVFILIVLSGGVAVGLIAAAFHPSEIPIEVLMLPYQLGVLCAPVLSLFILLFVAVMSMKYGYKLNKFAKQLKSHVEDKGAHK
jgi:uncharacterized membrane protein SpoIIM required for sporulation